VAARGVGKVVIQTVELPIAYEKRHLSTSKQTTKQKTKPIMKAKALLKRIESKSAPAIIDARTGIEFKRGHVPGAISAPPRKILQ
jgi:3-mercaptopyruvate sulfurtransferase SseA